MIEEILKKEPISKAKLERGIRSGSIVLVKNKVRDIDSIAIGCGVRTKINANMGASPEKSNLNLELKKADIGVKYGADTIMDLSVGSNLDGIRKSMLRHIKVPVGTVPIYQAFIEGNGIDMTLEHILGVIEKQCNQGVDFMTLHAGITKKAAEYAVKRSIPITSRGGAFIAAWMIENDEENPLYTHFNDILEILGQYDVTASLGDALRPGAISDSTDTAQIQELITLGRLTKEARKKRVGVIIEGPGHMSMDEIEANVKLEKKLCDNSPFYVLGPLVTDIALGYDHITGAIGGAIAAQAGADFLCYVTPSEHMGLPDEDDVKEGVIASKIAAHAADIVKLGDRKRDFDMGTARSKLDWNKMFELCINPDMKHKCKAQIKRKPCTMCGEYCALKIIEEHLKRPFRQPAPKCGMRSRSVA